MTDKELNSLSERLEAAEAAITETPLSADWFMWALETCLNEAVKNHGDPARVVAWDVRQAFAKWLEGCEAFVPIRTEATDE